MRIQFEKTTCTRCQGSGHYSYHPDHGTRCFGCSGSGERLSKQGQEAKAAYDTGMSIPVPEVLPGMVIMYRDHLAQRTIRCTVEASNPSPNSSWTTDAEGVRTYSDLWELGLPNMRLSTYMSGTVQLALTSATRDRARATLAGVPGVTITE
jgi:hypothetical protein